MKSIIVRAATILVTAAALHSVAAPAALAQAISDSYRVEANDTDWISLRVCGASDLLVRGDGDTDLDFWIYDSRNRLVHSDIDTTDVTFAELRPAGECERFRMRVSNLGDVWNRYRVSLD